MTGRGPQPPIGEAGAGVADEGRGKERNGGEAREVEGEVVEEGFFRHWSGPSSRIGRGACCVALLGGGIAAVAGLGGRRRCTTPQKTSSTTTFPSRRLHDWSGICASNRIKKKLDASVFRFLDFVEPTVVVCFFASGGARSGKESRYSKKRKNKNTNMTSRFGGILVDDLANARRTDRRTGGQMDRRPTEETKTRRTTEGPRVREELAVFAAELPLILDFQYIYSRHESGLGSR